jgi:prepilin-type N-terminal cleavage/methylation domain-containing protein
MIRCLLRRGRAEGGYSLVEMLTVMVILGVVMGALTTVFVSASHNELDMNNRFRAQQNARLALDKFRREVHCATSVTLGSGTSPAGPLAARSVTVVLPAGCRNSGTVTWCTAGSGNRWVLTRINGIMPAGGCVGGVKYADYFTLPNVFNYAAPAVGSRLLPKINVDFPVNVKPTRPASTYELRDDVVVRNMPRA